VLSELTLTFIIHRFPCISKDTPPVQESGHVKDISKVRFTCDGRYAISVGKADRSIIVWKVLSEEGKGRLTLEAEEEAEAAAGPSKKAGGKKKSMKPRATESKESKEAK
jgi:hypothetical protein